MRGVAISVYGRGGWFCIMFLRLDGCFFAFRRGLEHRREEVQHPLAFFVLFCCFCFGIVDEEVEIIKSYTVVLLLVLIQQIRRDPEIVFEN